MRLIYVITWRYFDGSASGVAAAHGTREGAETLLRILREQGDTARKFEIAEIPYQEAS